jgi:hypothetical protein
MPGFFMPRTWEADVTEEERRRLRAAGRRDAAATLPDVSPECARRIAEIMREPLNEYVSRQRKKGK